MAEALQGLLDRIQKDGIEKAETEAQAILEEARKKATDIKKAAEAEASRKIADAEAEAKKFEQRSVSAVQQAARDVVLSVGDAVQDAFVELTQASISETLDGEAFAKIIQEVIVSYAKDDTSPSIDVLLSEKQQEQVATFLKKNLTEKMQQGVTIQSSRGVISGFSVILRDQGVEHDFRGETLTAAFLQLLRPQLGAIIKKAMENVEPS